MWRVFLRAYFRRHFIFGSPLTKGWVRNRLRCQVRIDWTGATVSAAVLSAETHNPPAFHTSSCMKKNFIVVMIILMLIVFGIVYFGKDV